MPYITQEQYLIIALLFVILTSISIAVLIGIDKKYIDWARWSHIWLRLNNWVFFRNLKQVLFTLIKIITSPIWLAGILMALPIVILVVERESKQEKYNGPYDQEKDYEYIKMMSEVNKSSLRGGLPSQLRQIYRDLNSVTLNLDEDSEPELIYLKLKLSRLDDLLAFKQDAKSLVSMKGRIEGNISTLAYFWNDPSLERTSYFINKALDYAYSHKYISFP